MIKPGVKIGVVSHDAGGAEVLSSFLWKNKLKAQAFIAGPAIKIFNRKVTLSKASTLDQLLSNIDILLTGTSYPARLEWEAIKLAKKKSIKTIAFLDSWINYRVRFLRENQLIVPDIVCVSDDYAYQKAKEELLEFNIKRIDNFYKEYIMYSSQQLEKPEPSITKAKKILYVSEPTSLVGLKLFGNEKYWGYTEFEALDFFFANLDLLNVDIDEIIIKPHPSESSEKYSKYLTNLSYININSDAPLHELINTTDIIVGCTSMAMFVATWLEKRVISSIPPGGRGFYLPRDDIMFLSDMAEVNNEVKSNRKIKSVK